MSQQKIQSSQLADTGVTPDSYTSANLTIDSAGRITAATNGSGGAVDVFTLGLSSTAASFNGSAQTSWTGTEYVSATYCAWDTDTSTIIFSEAAYYRITIIATVATDTPNDWPADLASFGTTVTTALTPTSTRHSTTVPTGFGLDFGAIASYTSAPAQNAAVWTDSYVILSDGTDSQAVGVYAASYLSSFTTTAVQAFVTVERLGAGA